VLNLRRFASYPLVIALFAPAACAAPDHPPAESDDVSRSELASEDLTSADDEGGDGTGAQPSQPRTVCSPNEWRTCHYYYRDARGQLNCPLSYQFCRPDGRSWYACGKYRTAEDGSPLPPQE
jgi:hypothetical protein